MTRRIVVPSPDALRTELLHALARELPEQPPPLLILGAPALPP